MDGHTCMHIQSCIHINMTVLFLRYNPRQVSHHVFLSNRLFNLWFIFSSRGLTRCDKRLFYNQAWILNDSAMGHAEYSKETTIHIGLFEHQ